MPIAERLLVDTNILLEATDEKRAFHRAALELLESHRALSTSDGRRNACSEVTISDVARQISGLPAYGAAPSVLAPMAVVVEPSVQGAVAIA
jgi:predicted nucleic acid-binding protein